MPKKRGPVFFLKVIGSITLIALPFIIHFLISWLMTPSTVVRLAGGPDGGRYQELMGSLANTLRDSTQFRKVTVTSSLGTYENLRLLNNREVDFALIQSGSDAESDLSNHHHLVAFVSNVYPEMAHFMVNPSLTDEQSRNRSFGRFAIGKKDMGDSRLGNAFVEHLDLRATATEIVELNYSEIKQGFNRSELGAAIISVGLGSTFVDQLVTQGKCRLVSFPLRDAFLQKHIAYSSGSIPKGCYINFNGAEENENVESVMVNAQLITRLDIPATTVKAVLKTVHHAGFLKQNQLLELYQNGKSYALKKPDFSIHPAADRFYNPSIRPFINPELVDATEGIRSFVFSGLIGLFVVARWLKIRSARKHAHQLDKYIVRLLEIETEQMQLDRNYTNSDLQFLEDRLDEITKLRSNALREFTAHELKDDPAIECFISMSHALSEKINSKLTRDAIRKPNQTNENESNDV